MTAPANSFDATLWRARWQWFSSRAVRAFHAYANWLVSISWKRFIVLAVGLIVLVAILHDMPPFTWTVTEHTQTDGPRTVVIAPQAPRAPKPAAAPTPPEAPAPVDAKKKSIQIEAPGKGEGVEINIDAQGIRIKPKAAKAADTPASGALVADAATGEVTAEEAADKALRGLKIVVPPGVSSDAIRDAIASAKKQITEELAQAKEDAEEAKRDAEQARMDAQHAVEELTREVGRGRTSTRTTRMGIGDFMMQFTLLWVLASAIIKFSYKGRMQAEVKAAQATETAEAESLKRQVVEARMAAMQAQVEPHFLFNTLASIDHLIETDPARASVMQKNLIALLRASMPTMREANGDAGSDRAGVRDLGRELAVIRPYLEILKVRMEERLVTDVQVPDGLLSAAFPPMMIQTLVENAIKHGLEPKAEGGKLRVAAEIVHGKLQVTVADTGLGFGKAATAGTGVGLANIRERLQLLYGNKASLTVAENQPTGTVVTVTVPYTTVESAMKGGGV
jgi:Histidine kinase/Histidine kinase-, DNA gyrase B-, and HSP90-like ATPase